MITEKLELPGLINKQWLAEWDNVHFGGVNREKPQPHFYIFTIKSNVLKRLSKVYPRKAEKGRKDDSGIQRRHDPDRSADIKKYVHGGFPWSELSKSQKLNPDNDNLKMPGWLPTAIIANILAPNTQRGEHTLTDNDAVIIKNNVNSTCTITLPQNVLETSWDPTVAPIEIIDGQHRLWAFEKDEALDGDFEFPVIAFYNLDIAWQAYLFYTINIKPKKINASLAFDLYPILRVQQWLEASSEGNQVYKETRAQELTEVLWSNPKSPWYDKINMLGESNSGLVTQAAFIRSLIATFIKGLSNKGLGGLYGSIISTVNDNWVLPWNRPQQAAFLIYIWESITSELKNSEIAWAENLRQISSNSDQTNDEAFISRFSLLSTDQGVRGILHIYNDLCYRQASELGLFDIRWEDELKEDYIDTKDVNKALSLLNTGKIKNFINKLSKEVIKFNWSTSATPNLQEAEKQNQMLFKGSGGYKELRRQLLVLLQNSSESEISTAATEVFQILQY
ncbi:DGQHR domain-containing protein [Mucilaginibacter sp. SG538B]|uniref:DGQHR domain-containing protein n=1 Tax=Mucilaginibacter sp. SG538B TaxID=2587021 RepID=UPI00159D7597|nr:DGQHR domain-containing protein [Mucilaginibacter sp. SG538B]NVM63220.1 DGQHR domain-containing protein [Mucilaginibacter sp. SG538B]